MKVHFIAQSGFIIEYVNQRIAIDVWAKNPVNPVSLDIIPKIDHVFVTPVGKPEEEKDIMLNEPYDSPQKPFGGDEDFVWNPNSKEVVYCTKKEYGTAYTISTNTDLYAYDIATGKTRNLTEGMMGYDINPSFNKKGEMAWLSMKRAGYEADKQDIIVSNGTTKIRPVP